MKCNHMNMSKQARKTCKVKVIKSEQESNLHLPITGRVSMSIFRPDFLRFVLLDTDAQSLTLL